jgi:hydroxyproline O-arabinosyltransferase
MMDEMPTLLVKQLGHGRCAECDHGFIVMNRPWGVVQMVQSAH